MGKGGANLEPVLEWDSLCAGRLFPEVSCALDNDFVDAYLQATGETHPLYRRADATQDPACAGYAPPLCATFVRFVKASLGGRWPSGTLQLSQRLRSVRALRRGERVAIGVRINSVEQRNGRSYLELVSTVRDAQGAAAFEQAMLFLWAQTAVAQRAPAGARVRPSGTPRESLPQRVRYLGPVIDRFSMARVRAYAEIAGAHDPIHLDPEFARTTSVGVNIAQGKLVMTLVTRLMLEHMGVRWLERGSLDLRLRRPVRVDEPIQAWAVPIGDADFSVWCENAGGERVIEGTASV